MSYRVMVDDNFHYMDESQRYQKGEYASYADARHVQGHRGSVPTLRARARDAGERAVFPLHDVRRGPVLIVDHAEPPDPSPGFSAWDYAKVRCQELCEPAPEASAACA